MMDTATEIAVRSLCDQIVSWQQRAAQVLDVEHDPVVDAGRVVDEVDLVDRDDDVGHPQKAHDGEVTPGLLDHTVARVDEDEHDVRRRGAGEPISRTDTSAFPGAAARLTAGKNVLTYEEIATGSNRQCE